MSRYPLLIRRRARWRSGILILRCRIMEPLVSSAAPAPVSLPFCTCSTICMMPAREKVLIYGKDVRSYKENELTKIVGLVPQRGVLFHGSIRDNIRFGREDITDDMIATAVHAAQADNVIESKEHGLDEEILQDARNLSGGQRQRLMIARALAGTAEDPGPGRFGFCTGCGNGRSTAQGDPRAALASDDLYRIAACFLCDGSGSILVMEDGCIVGKGKHEDLLRDNAIYQEIYYSQFPKDEKEQNS